MTRAIKRVTVVTAHPDDPEFGAGGTIAKLVKEGREVPTPSCELTIRPPPP